MGALLLVVGLGGAHTALFADVASRDRLASDEAPWVLALYVMMGAAYTYVAATMEVTSSEVVIRNPLRGIVIPLGHVTSVREGSNLRIETGYCHAYAWGVEAANVDLVIGRMPKQASLSELIMSGAAARRATDDELAPARYQWALPPMFVLLMGPLYLVTALAIQVDWHPIG